MVRRSSSSYPSFMATVLACGFGAQSSGILDFFFRFLTFSIFPPAKGVKGVILTSSILLVFSLATSRFFVKSLFSLNVG